MNFRFIPFLIIFSICLKSAFCIEPQSSHSVFSDQSNAWLKKAIVLKLSSDDVKKDCSFEKIRGKLPKLKQHGINVLYLPQLFQVNVKHIPKETDKDSVILNTVLLPEIGTRDQIKAFFNDVSKAGFKILMEFPLITFDRIDETILNSPKLENAVIRIPLKSLGVKTNGFALNVRNETVRGYLRKTLDDILKTYPVSGFGFDDEQILNLAGLKEFLNAFVVETRLVLLINASENLPSLKNGCYLGNPVSKTLNDVLFNSADVNRFVDACQKEKGFNNNQQGILLRTNEVYYENKQPLKKNNEFKKLSLKTVLDYTLGSFSGLPTLPIILNDGRIGELIKQSLCLNESDVWQDERKKAFMNLYLKLGFMRASHDVFFNGKMTRLKTANDHQIFAFTRENNTEKTLVVVNLKDKPFTGYIALEEERLLHNYLEPEKYRSTKDGTIKFSLAGYDYLIFMYK